MDQDLISVFLATSAIAAAAGLSGCWVTEQCSVPGDEDGDGLEGCDDPDCFGRALCAGGGGPLDIGDDDDFDDDDFSDDDDFDSDGLTFSFDLVATPNAGGGDDDSADDDGKRLSYAVTTEFTITHWVDIQNGIQNCDQHVTLEGEAWFMLGIVDSFGDVGTCENCTGFVTYDPTTRTDISDPSVDPDHCELANLQAVGMDYGTRMLSPADPNATPVNYGDFLTAAFWDYETHQVLGTDLSVNSETDRTAEGSRAEWEQFNLTYTHTGFAHAHPQSLAGSAGLDSINRAPHTGSDYLAAWEVFLDPATNEHDPAANADMQGAYGGSANYILTLGGR